MNSSSFDPSASDAMWPHDVALLVNQAVPQGIVALMIEAFDGAAPTAP